MILPAASSKFFPCLLAVPFGMAWLALSTGQLVFKLGEPAACAVLMLLYRLAFGARHVGWLLAAMVWSMVGDYFLSSRNGHPEYFVYGIGAFLVAHLGYLGFALKNGRISRLALGLLLLGYLPFFGFYLHPAITDSAVRYAALAYLLVSCVSMAAAFGLRLDLLPKAAYVAGIGLVLFSDTIIAWSEFLRYRQWNALILPTYYLAHMSVALALFWRETPSRDQPPTPAR